MHIFFIISFATGMKIFREFFLFVYPVLIIYVWGLKMQDIHLENDQRFRRFQTVKFIRKHWVPLVSVTMDSDSKRPEETRKDFNESLQKSDCISLTQVLRKAVAIKLIFPFRSTESCLLRYG
jgi:hypothetical protein